jgi:uncharacterized membrane protein
MEFLVGLALLVLAISTRMSLNRALERLRELEDALESQQIATTALERQLKRVTSEMAPAPASTAPAQPAAAPQAPAVTSPPAVPSASKPPVTPPPAPEQKPAAPAPPPAVPSALPSQPAAPPVPPARPAPPSTPPPSPPPPPRPSVPPAPPKPPFDWESLLGVRLASAVAGIALVVGAVLFLKISIDRGWLAPPIRVLIGVITAVVLLVVCERKAARRYHVTANALDAAAIAILFSTFFAAHALWGLIPTTPTFLLLALVTAVAVLLSIRRESMFIAVLGLLGGFLTPILLSTGENRPIPLFSYLLLLNVGLAWVAYQKRWPALTVLSAIFTTIYQWAWVIKFLHESSLSLAMGVFLVFPAAALAGAVLFNPRGAGSDRHHAVFERTGLFTSVAPLVFAIYLAAIPAYGARAGLLFGFLFIIDAGLLAIAIGRREEWLHAVAGATTLLVFGLWLGMSFTATAWTTMLIAVPVFALMYLAGPLIATMVDRRFGETGQQTIYVAPLLLFAFAMLARTDRAATSPIALFLVLFALAGVIAWRAIAGRQGGLYFVAAFFALAAEATWSALHLTTESLHTAVGLYGAFGLFAIGVPIIARRLGRPLEPAYGGGTVLISGLAMLLFLAAGSVAPAAIWGLALLLAILNAALFVESASGRMPAIAIVGGLLSWIVLAIWWWQAAAIVGPLPALLVVVILALVMLAGHAWADAQMPRAAAVSAPVGFRHGLFLGLVGHFFLCFVAANPLWSQPPWEMFGALGVLTLAVSVVSLSTSRGQLQIAAATAAAIVVTVWSVFAPGPPWPLTAILAAASVSVYALIWIAVAARRRGLEKMAAIAAGVSLFVGEATAIIAAMQEGEPSASVLIGAHAATAATILALAWRYRWEWIASVAVLPVWLATVNFQMRHQEPAAWGSVFAFAAVLYAVFAAYPFVLGRRTQASRDPYVAAILASAMFLLVARTALERGGYSLYIGAVPVFEGAVLALLLRQLLRQEAAGSRDLGRLALVAGAALAFITIAIPLQLDEQWITIGWAVEGAALAWLATRVPHAGLRYGAVGLLAVVFVRLVCNPDVFYYEPRGAMRVFNWYLYTYTIAAAATMLAARWIGRTVWGRGRGIVPGLLYTSGAVMLFWLLNIEIADVYATGPEIAFRFGVSVAQDLTYTIGWLMFGLVALATGIITHSRTTRIASLVLVAVTTVKCFLYDLRSLDGLYRVSAFVGLGISLALVSVAMQKYVLKAESPREPVAEP